LYAEPLRDPPGKFGKCAKRVPVSRNESAATVLDIGQRPAEDDLERGATRNYDYIGPRKLQRVNDRTPELPPGIGRTLMPYPEYGLEFSNGLHGHLTVRLAIHGDDMWIKDNIDL